MSPALEVLEGEEVGPCAGANRLVRGRQRRTCEVCGARKDP